MTKDEIRIEAFRRMASIEERFIDSHVPSEIMSFYMLLKLIHSTSFDEYFAEFGFRPLHPGDINDAKQDLGWGPISSFEREVCDLLNQRIEEKEMGRIGYRNNVVQVRALSR